MLLCRKCGQYTALYDGQHHQYVCTSCGHVEQTTPHEARCWNCGGTYTEWTWFDPSGCPHCYRSFVD